MAASGPRTAHTSVLGKVAFVVIAFDLLVTALAIASSPAAHSPVPAVAMPVAGPATRMGGASRLLAESQVLRSVGETWGVYPRRATIPGTVLVACGPGTVVSDQPSVVRGSTCVPDAGPSASSAE